MPASERKNKDANMAAYMKRKGIQRTTQRCPICYKIVANKMFDQHIATHK